MVLKPPNCSTFNIKFVSYSQTKIKCQNNTGPALFQIPSGPGSFSWEGINFEDCKIRLFEVSQPILVSISVSSSRWINCFCTNCTKGGVINGQGIANVSLSGVAWTSNAFATTGSYFGGAVYLSNAISLAIKGSSFTGPYVVSSCCKFLLQVMR
jgi:hypothetical protein